VRIVSSELNIKRIQTQNYLHSFLNRAEMISCINVLFLHMLIYLSIKFLLNFLSIRLIHHLQCSNHRSNIFIPRMKLL
jgi:hypothetical protein